MSNNSATAEATSNNGSVTACTHCGSPTVEGMEFCCQGCSTAYAIVRGYGLDDYYAMRERLYPQAIDPVSTGSNQALFAAESVIQQDQTVDANGLAVMTVRLHGLHCTACCWLIENILVRTEGVTACTVSYEQSTATVRFDPSIVSASDWVGSIEKIGYSVSRYYAHKSDSFRAEQQALIGRVGVAASVFLNAMILQFPEYYSAFGVVSANYEILFSRILSLIVLPVVLYSAYPFHRAAIAAIKAGRYHLDIPLSVAVIVAYVGSVWMTWFGDGPIYYDAVSGVVFFVLAARLYAQRAQWHAQQELAKNRSAGIGLVKRVRQNADNDTILFDMVPASDIAIGDIIQVDVDAEIPCDGELLDSNAFVQEAILTGEFRASRKEVGAVLFAGTIAAGQSLSLRVSAPAEDSYITHLFAAAQLAKSQNSVEPDSANRLAPLYLIASLVGAAAALAVGSFSSGHEAIGRAIAVFVVLCPCTISLAIPLLLTYARARSLRAGLQVTDTAIFERWQAIDTVIFDKTGTLTDGGLSFQRWLGLRYVDAIDLAPLVAQLESFSGHPIARALVSQFGTMQPGLELDTSSVEEVIGSGIRGRFGTNTLHLRRAVPADAEMLQLGPMGSSTVDVVVEWNHRTVAMLLLDESLHTDSIEVVQYFHDQGKRVVLLTGDNFSNATTLASKLGITDVFCEQSPEGKITIMQQLKTQGLNVAMIGDGINDTGAMAEASVAIAMCAAKPETKECAHAYMVRPGIKALQQLDVIADSVVGNVRRSLRANLAYNLIAGMAAVVGAITPLIAAVIMPISSLVNVVAARTVMRMRTQ